MSAKKPVIDEARVRNHIRWHREQAPWCRESQKDDSAGFYAAAQQFGLTTAEVKEIWLRHNPVVGTVAGRWGDCFASRRSPRD